MPCPNCRCPSCLTLAGSTIPSIESSLPPSELMTANRAPTNSEVVYSRDVISSSEIMVSLIRSTVNNLEKRKAELLSLANKHKAVISPLRSFPPELLVEIFVRCTAAMRFTTFPQDFTPPLKLMWICSRWRRIVHDTPRLWTKIWGAYPMIDCWITQSKVLPLHLSLSLPAPVAFSTLRALIPHSHRWESVHFDLESSSHSALAPTRTRLQSLRKLALDFGDTTGTVDFCEVAPQLTEIELMSINEPVIIKLPWEQLHKCTLDNTEITHYVLQHTKNLRVLLLDIAYGASEPHELMLRSPHSCHLGLGTLIMRINFGFPGVTVDCISFFQSITLPSLQTLKLDFSYLGFGGVQVDVAEADREELASNLAGFFKRSCAHLSTLKLNNIPFSQTALIECLVFSPSLTSLDIQFDERWHEINKELLATLNINHSRNIIPRLRSLSLRGPVGMIEEHLDTLVTSRRHINPKHDGVALLEDLTLECVFPWSGPPLFHRFVSEGLNLDITYKEDFTEPDGYRHLEDWA